MNHDMVATRHLAKECQKRISRLPNKFEVCCGKGETHQEAADGVRQEPGCVAVRHFCDWLGATARTRQSSPYLESPQVSGSGIRDLSVGHCPIYYKRK